MVIVQNFIVYERFKAFYSVKWNGKNSHNVFDAVLFLISCTRASGAAKCCQYQFTGATAIRWTVGHAKNNSMSMGEGFGRAFY